MVEARIGNRYANSLFGLAQEQKVLNEVKEDMTIVHTVVQENRELRNLLNSPIIPSSKKHSILKKLFEKKLSSTLSMQIIDLLSRKSREAFIPYMAEAFLSLYDKEFDIVRGTLISSYEMPDSLVSHIVDKLEAQLNKTLILQKEIDHTMIGGFKIQIGDQLYDGSVNAALRKMKHNFGLN